MDEPEYYVINPICSAFKRPIVYYEYIKDRLGWRLVPRAYEVENSDLNDWLSLYIRREETGGM